LVNYGIGGTVFVLTVIMAMLAVTRITRLVTTDQLTVRLRQLVVRRWHEESWQVYLVHCDWCSSMWVALLVMPATVLLAGGSWLLAVLSVPAASYVTGFLVSKE